MARETMKNTARSIAYVRQDEAPRLPPPAGSTGLQRWLQQNLFYSPLSSILTIVLLLLAGAFLYSFFNWAIFNAAWTGEGRAACLGEEPGACWPFVRAKFAQWIYGFYPFEERWRVNIVFLVGALTIIPLLMPSVGHKLLNAVFFLVIFPLFSFIMLSGGHLDIHTSSFLAVLAVMIVCAVFLPMALYGIEPGIQRNKLGFWLVLLGLAPLLLGVAVIIVVALLAMVDTVVGWFSSAGDSPAIIAAMSNYLTAFDQRLTDLPYLKEIAGGLVLVGAALSLFSMVRAGRVALVPVAIWLGIFSVILLAMWLLQIDFGLTYVDTPQWGGLLVTLVVAIFGIVMSLPLGILLALGRRSSMPAVKYFCVAFIEGWRGVPMITVLFMASVMLPLFLPPGTHFDKLSRALVAVAIFASAYMAEVVRGGLQAIPKGQVEAAQALGLSYWQTTGLIVLPQALKIVIPGIMNTFISLFKDTTLVTVVGIFDLLQMVTSTFSDAKWASPNTASTGYFVAAVIFWVFCFSMSRYSQSIERRLDTGHKR